MTTGATTGTTDCSGTYPICTACTGVCVTIIPDTGATYCFNILLKQDTQDIGFFDAYLLSGVTGTTAITTTHITVTGNSASRLVELRKYVISGTTAQIYVTGGNLTTDGVDLAQTTNNMFVYFLGGIRYVDVLSGITSGTTFSFVGQGLSSPTLNLNYINKPIYKNPDKENIISNPKIYDDVFIVRQELSAFDKNYRLEFIRNLVDLETYASGKFFNIVNNT